MSINQYLDKIKAAARGEEVRGSIHDAIAQCYEDATGNPQSVAGVIQKAENIEKSVEIKNKQMEEAIKDRFENLGTEVESTMASKANRLEMFPYYPDFNSYDFSKTDPVFRKVVDINEAVGNMMTKKITYQAPFDGFVFCGIKTVYGHVREMGSITINGCIVYESHGSVETEPSAGTDQYPLALTSPMYPVKKNDSVTVQAYIYKDLFVTGNPARKMFTYFMKPRYVGTDEQTITTKVNQIEAKTATNNADISSIKTKLSEFEAMGITNDELSSERIQIPNDSVTGSNGSITIINNVMQVTGVGPGANTKYVFSNVPLVSGIRYYIKSTNITSGSRKFLDYAYINRDTMEVEKSVVFNPEGTTFILPQNCYLGCTFSGETWNASFDIEIRYVTRKIEFADQEARKDIVSLKDELETLKNEVEGVSELLGSGVIE